MPETEPVRDEVLRVAAQRRAEAVMADGRPSGAEPVDGRAGGRGRAGFVAGLGGRDGHQLRTPRRSPGEHAVPSLVPLGVSL